MAGGWQEGEGALVQGAVLSLSSRADGTWCGRGGRLESTGGGGAVPALLHFGLHAEGSEPGRGGGWSGLGGGAGRRAGPPVLQTPTCVKGEGYGRVAGGGAKWGPALTVLFK